MSEPKKYHLKDYIEIVSAANQILHVQPIGFLSNEGILSIKDEYWVEMKKSVAKLEGKPFVLIVDMSNSAVASSGGQNLAKEALSYYLQNGLIGSIEVHTSALTKMASNRIVQSSESLSKFHRVTTGSLEEAFVKAKELLSEAGDI